MRLEDIEKIQKNLKKTDDNKWIYDGDLDLREILGDFNNQLVIFPNHLTIKGSLIFSNIGTIDLPKEVLIVHGNLNGVNNTIRQIPYVLECGTYIDLSHCIIDKLPPITKTKTLIIHNTGIKNLPKDLKIKNLSVDNKDKNKIENYPIIYNFNSEFNPLEYIYLDFEDKSKIKIHEDGVRNDIGFEKEEIIRLININKHRYKNPEKCIKQIEECFSLWEKMKPKNIKTNKVNTIKMGF